MTTDNALNALEEILGNLPDADKKRLAALLTKGLPPPNPQEANQTISTELIREEINELGRPKKRKQRRGGKGVVNKPVRTDKKKKKKQHRGMGEGTGAKIARTESMELGPKPNRCDDKNDIYYLDRSLSRKDAKDDKVLWGDNKRTPRLGRQPEFLTAKCSKCEFEFDNVPASICYQDDEGTVFCCDDCGKKH